jgi:molecular chaperone DnaK
MAVIIGIDFGTTNTLCAWMDGDIPIVLPNDRGDRTTPSVMAVTDSAEILIGISARNQAMVDPASAVFGIKRLLGRQGRIRCGTMDLDTEDIAAAILAKIRKDAEAYLGQDVHEAVITVPARFSDPQRRSVRDAARRAGLKVVRVMNEPTAAALARAWATARDEVERTVLIYDFGGGTFDATVLQARGGSCRVLASEGDDSLGGMDLDTALYQQVAARFDATFNITPATDPYLSRLLMDLCEKAKIELSSRRETVISIPFLKGPGGLVHPHLKISRDDFDAIAAPFIDRSIVLVQRVLTAAGLESSNIDALVLSGGSSRIPLVTARLQDCFDRSPDSRVNPEEIVALGAAVEAARLEGRLVGLSFIDVCSRTFGLEIDGGRFIPLIRKNATLPASGRRVFTTIEDFQRTVEMHVLQGDSTQAADNVSVGRFLLPGIRAAARGEPRILVEFSIDEGDMLMVKAKDLDTGSAQSVLLFDGTINDMPPVERVRTLAERARREAVGVTMDSSLSNELDELLESAERAAANGDEQAATGIAVLLEGLLGELSARAVAAEHATVSSTPMVSGAAPMSTSMLSDTPAPANLRTGTEAVHHGGGA